MSFPPISALLPHRGPMLLLDEVCDADQVSIACGVVVDGTSLLAQGGRVGGAIAVEYMAQCVAAFVGLRAVARGEPVRVGYLVGANEVVLEADHFEAGDRLRVEARHVFGDAELGQFVCRVIRTDHVVASATLSVHQRPRGT